MQQKTKISTATGNALQGALAAPRRKKKTTQVKSELSLIPKMATTSTGNCYVSERNLLFTNSDPEFPFVKVAACAIAATVAESTEDQFHKAAKI